MSSSSWLASASDWPVAVLAWMMALMPALGVPSELMLQDTLKSTVAAFGVLIAALVFFWQQRHRTEPLLWHGMLWLPITLMLYALGSMVWSHTYLAGVETIRWFIVSLLMWLGLNTFTRRNLPLLFWGIHGGAVVASLWAVLQFWFDLGLFPQAAPPSSTFINRNFFAEYLVATLPFSVYLLINFKNSRWLGVVALSLALNVIALLMTGTRSALVALLILVPVFLVILLRYHHTLTFPRWSRANKVMVCLVLITGVLGLGSVPTGSEKIRQEATGTTALQRSFNRVVSMTEHKEYTERSFSIRSQMWMATARMMMANPWTGIGAGAWEVQIPLYQRNYTVLETDYYAHNEFLQLLSEYGLPVGGLALAFLLAYLIQASATTFHPKNGESSDAPTRAAILASLLALLIVSNAGFPLHLASCSALLALCLGLLTATDSWATQKQASHLSRHSRHQAATKIMLGFTSCCLVLSIYITVQAARAERMVVRAIHLGAFLGKELPPPARPEIERKAEMLTNLRGAIAINPHYRRFTAVAAERLSASGDYANAAAVLETVVRSRPHVAALWSGLAFNDAKSGQAEKANQAFHEVERLKPAEATTLTLQATLLSLAGKDSQAIELLNRSLDDNQFDFDLLQTAYALGLKVHDKKMAIRSLTLFNQTWPQYAADTYLRIGKVYADDPEPDNAKALEAFKLGLKAVPESDKEKYLDLIPAKVRALM